MKVWKQKLAAAVLAGMLLGAGCTEELDPRPPSAELTEEELLEIQENAAEIHIFCSVLIYRDLAQKSGFQRL